MRTRLAIACGLMVFAMPALAQTTTTTCRNTFGGVTCDSRTQQPWTMPEIKQVDVAGALRTAEEARLRRAQLDHLERQADALVQKKATNDTTANPRPFGEDPNVEFVRFREANEWYDLGGMASATLDERRARAMADRIADRMSAEGLQKEIAPSEFFARVAAEVLQKIPGLSR